MGTISTFAEIRKSGLLRRWMINCVALVVVLLVLGGVGYSVLISQYYFAGVRAALESRASSAANYFSKNIGLSYDDYYASAEIFCRDFNERELLELQFINEVGRVEIAASGNTVGFGATTRDVSDALKTGIVQTWSGNDPYTGERVLAVSAPLYYNNTKIIGVMRYVTSLSEVDRRVQMFVWPTVIVVMFLFAGVIAMNIIFMRGIVRPINKVIGTARNIAEGGYGAQLENVYRDEIGVLAETINEMSTAICGAERQKSEFMAAVSHELRTPITAIKGWGELLLTSENFEPEEVRGGLRVMLKETERLYKLVEELLDYTRMDTGRLTMIMESFDLSSEVEEIVFVYMNSLRGIKLAFDHDGEEMTIRGDRARVRQVALNILDNASKHGRSGGRIDVQLQIKGKNAVLTVRDYGKGIPKKDLPHVKERFFRGAGADSGTGMGLALSDEIVRLHGGEMEIESTVGTGTTVTVTLPISS